MAHEEFVKKVLCSRASNGNLKSRESNTVEFKESFNKANVAKYAKTMAAFSNNRGGYIIFGVKDNPRMVVGLKNNNFDNLNQELFSEAINSLFAPAIEWECGMFTIDVPNTNNGSTESIKIGWIYASEADYKPVIAQKVNDGERISSGDVFYRYRARNDKIRYAEMSRIIEERAAKERESMLKLFDIVRNSNTANLGIINYTNGRVTTPYAKMLDIPFAYSSNGDGFAEHDFLTGLEREFGMDEFPTEAELVARYKAELNDGAGVSPIQESILAQPYYSSHNTYAPRYYQRIAVNRTLDAIAKGQNRLLLVMATGTGKTYTAFQIVYRLLKSGLKKKILYLADRNILVDQSIQQDFSPLEKTIHKINFAKDDPTTITSHEVYFSLYQQLAGNDDDDTDDGNDDVTSRFEKLFKPDFFDLVIVDECHRGSAKKDSNWRKILEYFSSATQLGMTATPKETEYISNIDYFGEPVYTYSLREGIDDGFLAPFRVINIKTNIGEGWRPFAGQCDKNGMPIEDRIYTNSDFDYNIILEDRTNEVAREITKYLKSTGRMQKTIVFCATEDHAERMRVALNNLNADMCQTNSDYVVRITGSDTYGKSKLDYFISVSAEYPVIATTSKLLSTGADCKMTKLIVLDEMISSMTEFKQIIGRGTRLREKDGKTHFVVMDFRNVTRLFADPDWDGPIEIDPDYPPKPKPGPGPGPVDPPPPPPPPKLDKPIVSPDGCRVEVIGKTVSIYDSDGKLLRHESIEDYTKSNILGRCASLDNFISMWTAEEKKVAIKDLLMEQGIDLEKMKADHDMADIDDFDFICHVAYDAKPLTRRERANNVKKRDFLSKYSGVAREVLEALLEKYMNFGIYEIENTDVLELDPFMRFGKKSKIMRAFGGREQYLQAIKELENELYKAA